MKNLVENISMDSRRRFRAGFGRGDPAEEANARVPAEGDLERVFTSE